jgi:putative tryptophan/tyrosine transport system substrate-binding protein
MQRRDFITFVGGATASWPLAARTQTLQRRRIGFLALGSGPSPSTDAFQDGLRTLGYVDGQTILIDFRYCSGDVDQLRIQAAGLIKSGVELIVAPDTVSAIVAGQATSTIPIVFAVAADPLATGLVSNVARPSGNLTGLTSGNSETVGKRLELLKEAFPEIVRLACIFNASDPSNVAALPAGLVTTANVRQIVQRANATGLPSIYSLLFFAQQGGVMAYSANSADLYRRAAGYVAKLLKGSKPVD